MRTFRKPTQCTYAGVGGCNQTPTLDVGPSPGTHAFVSMCSFGPSGCPLHAPIRVYGGLFRSPLCLLLVR